MSAERETPSPIDSLWTPRASTWTVIIVVGLSLALTLAPGQPAAPLWARASQFGLTALVAFWIALLPLASLYLLRRKIALLPPIKVAWIGFALLIASAALISVLSFLAARALLGVDVSLSELVARICALTLIVGLISLAGFQTLWQNRELKGRADRSEQDALRARTHPHFLFNTLNTAISLTRSHPERVEQVLLNLSDLFRATLSAKPVWTLKQDIELAHKYLEIESLRFGDRLRVRWNTPANLPDVDVPTLSLQPLVENAVQHGIERRPEGGEILISIQTDASTLELEVCNDLGEPGAPARHGHHLGLDAVRSRIEGSGGGTVTTRTVDGRYVACIRLPMVRST